MWSIGSRDSVGVAVLRAFAAAAYRALGSEQTAVRQPQGVSAQRHWATAGFIVVMGVKLSTVYRRYTAVLVPPSRYYSETPCHVKYCWLQNEFLL